MNPDGWEYNRSTNPNGGGMWRKNRKKVWNRLWSRFKQKLGCAGQIAMHQLAAPVSVVVLIPPSSETYCGPSAFSEPETQAVRALQNQKFFYLLRINMRMAFYYSIPPGRQQDALSSADLKFYVELCAYMGKI